MPFNLKRCIKSPGLRTGLQVILYLAMAVTILSLLSLFVAAITIFFSATVHVTFADASGETIPTRFTGAFKVYLVEYPNEKDSEYIELIPGVEERIPSGIYHLQVYYDDKNILENDSPPDPESKGTLLYDEEISLPGFTHRSKEVQLDSVYIQHYEIQVTPLGHGYLLEKPRDKIIVKTRF